MKSIIISIAALMAALYGYVHPVKVSGHIEGNTEWKGRVILQGDVYVAPGTVLTVEPGTHIEYSKRKIKSEIQHLRNSSGGTYDIFREGKIELIIAGDLVINGTQEEPVVIKAPPDKETRAGGICFIGVKSTSTIRHTLIKGGYIGIRVYDGRAPYLVNLTVEDNDVGGVGCWDRSKPVITESIFVRNKYGIGASDISAPLIERSTVKNNSASGIFFEGKSNGEVCSCLVTGNNVGVAFGDEALGRVMTSTISANGSGIGVWKKSAPEIIDCDFTTNIVGILVLDNSIPDVRANVFYKNGGGVTISDSGKPVISANIFRENGPGIVISGRSAPDITENYFEGNDYALMAERVSRPRIKSNTFSENRVGILMEDYTKPVRSGNSFSRNSTDTLDNRLSRKK